MSGSSTLEPDAVFAGIPSSLRGELTEEYNKIVRNFREGRWEPAELNGGKLCEIVYSIVSGYSSGSYPAKAFKPSNMYTACTALEKLDKSAHSRSVRIQIPRILIALYEVRNNRGVGHVGGDVNPNHMDAVLVLSMAKWLHAEMVRVFHGTDVDAARQVVDGLVDRTLPLIWHVDGKPRVLKPSLTVREKMLAVLYAQNAPVKVATVADWIEYANVSRFRTTVVKKAHKEKLLEHSRDDFLTLSPLGSKYVEEKIALEV